MIVGYNADEGSVFGEFFTVPESRDRYRQAMEASWGDSAQSFLAAYPASRDDLPDQAKTTKWSR